MSRRKKAAAAPTRIQLPHGMVAHVILRDQLPLLIDDTTKPTKGKP
jgi:hypothetical protein